MRNIKIGLLALITLLSVDVQAKPQKSNLTHEQAYIMFVDEMDEEIQALRLPMILDEGIKLHDVTLKDTAVIFDIRTRNPIDEFGYEGITEAQWKEIIKTDMRNKYCKAEYIKVLPISFVLRFTIDPKNPSKKSYQRIIEVQSENVCFK